MGMYEAVATRRWHGVTARPGGTAEPVRTRSLLSGAQSCRLQEPESGTGLAQHLRLFHDAEAGIFSCATHATRTDARLSLVFYQFAGSFFSVVGGLPDDALARFGPDRRLEILLDAKPSRPITAFIRLNLRQGDAHEVLHETIVIGGGMRCVSFDLGAFARHGKPADGWIDLILHRPRMCHVALTRFDVQVLG